MNLSYRIWNRRFSCEFTGKKFEVEEADQNLWLKVIDHKWYISEHLNRDIGLRVAAIDFLQNFYEAPCYAKK